MLEVAARLGDTVGVILSPLDRYSGVACRELDLEFSAEGVCCQQSDIDMLNSRLQHDHTTCSHGGTC